MVQLSSVLLMSVSPLLLLTFFVDGEPSVAAVVAAMQVVVPSLFLFCWWCQTFAYHEEALFHLCLTVGHRYCTVSPNSQSGDL